VLVIGREWLEGFKSLATFPWSRLGGNRDCAQGPATNLAGWAFIVWRRRSKVGDRIEIAKHKGDVIDIRLFPVHPERDRWWVDADQSTGRIVHVPNQQVFTGACRELRQGFKYIWNEVPVLVTYESNGRRSKRF